MTINKEIILDTPDQIRAYGMLQLYYKLKLEVENPNGPKWRDSPMKQVMTILRRERIGCVWRKAVALEAYREYLIAIGVLREL